MGDRGGFCWGIWSGGENQRERQCTVRAELSQEQTRAMLEELPKVYRTQIQEVLLTALGEALEEWSGRTGVLVDVEGHGREDLGGKVDVSRTVGWFTAIYPMPLGREGKTLTEQIG